PRDTGWGAVGGRACGCRSARQRRPIERCARSPPTGAAHRSDRGAGVAAVTVFHFWRAHTTEFMTLLGQHVLLVGASTLVAILAGVPIGILAARKPRAGA